MKNLTSPSGRQQSHPNLQITRVIGHGAFGYVFEAYCKQRQTKVALKRSMKVGNIVSREHEVMSLTRDC